MKMSNIFLLMNQFAGMMGGSASRNMTISSNMVFLTGANNHVCYIKIRNSNVGFWGLADNQLNYLSSQSTAYTVILISNTHAYFLDAHSVAWIQSNMIVASDGAFKINNRDLVRIPNVITINL